LAVDKELWIMTVDRDAEYLLVLKNSIFSCWDVSV